MSTNHKTPSIALSGRKPIEGLIAPFQRFARLEAASGIVLLIFAAAALIIANGPLGHAYHDILMSKGTIGVGAWTLTLSVEQWINDGLMATFFFLVGLEIKREVVIGELSNPRKAAVPIAAAVGGMLVPGLVYAAFNWGRPTIRGWGVPTATDIAFSLGVLALLGKRVPAGVRLFLATLAIADDLGALIVIAVFYTEELRLDALMGAGVCFGIMVALNTLGARKAWAYALVGLVLWYFVLMSGVHATIAGVLGAMAIPVSARVDGGQFVNFVRRSLTAFEHAGPPSNGSALGHETDTPHRGRIIPTDEQQAAVQGIEDACNKVQTPLHTLEHAMAPWVAFVVIPIFALANAGVHLGGVGGDAGGGAEEHSLLHAFTQRETLGVMLGLLLGKPIGITLVSLLAVKSGLGALPSGVTWRHLHGASWLAGIGFTMSLFIANLAFAGGEAAEKLNDAKIGILSGSLVAGIVGFMLLRLGQQSDRGT